MRRREPFYSIGVSTQLDTSPRCRTDPGLRNSVMEETRAAELKHLLQQARAGDRLATERLLRECQPDLRRYARRHCESADVDDAVQDALWILTRRVAAVRAAAALSSWLFQVVRRICLRLRSKSKEYVQLDETMTELAQGRRSRAVDSNCLVTISRCSRVSTCLLSDSPRPSSATSWTSVRQISPSETCLTAPSSPLIFRISSNAKPASGAVFVAGFSQAATRATARAALRSTPGFRSLSNVTILQRTFRIVTKAPNPTDPPAGHGLCAQITLLHFDGPSECAPDDAIRVATAMARCRRGE